MKIRKATKKDLDGILELADLMLDFHYKMDSYYKIYSKYENPREFYESHLKKKNVRYVVAENTDGELIGFASASVTSIPRTKAPKVGALITNFVKKEYRGKGIGTKLFKDQMKWLKENNVKHVEMSVDVRNKKAIILWKKYGFEDYQVRLRKDL
jgi:ribosomal protein S18 acetylase RimI-like enzyme